MRILLVMGLLLGIVATGFIASQPETITFQNIDYADIPSIAGRDIPLGPGEAFFSDLGITFEGVVADRYEGLLTPIYLSSDRSWYLPDVSGLLITKGLDDAINSSSMIRNGTVRENDLHVVNAPGDEDCLTYETTEDIRRQTDNFEWEDCLGRLKPAFLEALVTDPEFAAAVREIIIR